MAVQVGRTVISFTIKYVQSERDKLKSDVSKVLDSKMKSIKPAGQILPKPHPNINDQLDPQMQATGVAYQPNMQIGGDVAEMQMGYHENVEDDDGEANADEMDQA